MNGDFHSLDIVFFAVVAVFIVLRLRSVLGRRTGNERPPPAQWGARPEAAAEADPAAPGNVIDLASARKPAPAEDLPPGALGEGVAAIRAADPSFTLASFLTGARAAFEMIVDAYAAGDTKALRPLLGDSVYEPFARAIDDRRRNGEELVTELMGIRKVEAMDARMDGTVAEVTVRFVSEQVNTLKDAEGRVVEGDPTRITDVIDVWSFRRDTRAKDPNWYLSATRSDQDLKD